MSVPGTRARELVPVLRLRPGDLIVLAVPRGHGDRPEVHAQAEYLAGRTGNPVVCVSEGYDVLALEPELVLETIARNRGERFIRVSEGAIPDGPPPPGKRVVVREFSRADDAWGVRLVLRSEPDLREALREIADGKLDEEAMRERLRALAAELDPKEEK